MIQLENLTVENGEFSLCNVELKVAKGSYATLMGASGVGKTTLLEAISGLRRVRSGTIYCGDQEITDLRPADRQIGFVPQDLALFPTMRVGPQIGFGLSVRKLDSNSIRNRIAELADLLELSELLKRYPHELSGGQQQRVALARAIAFHPKLLLLDEPLGSLDEPTRLRMVKFLKSIHQNEEVTVLHVTHNMAEALELATQKFEFSDTQIVEL